MSFPLRSFFRSFLAIATLLLARGVEAAPITSGTGPGGIGALGFASQGPVLWLDANNNAQAAIPVHAVVPRSRSGPTRQPAQAGDTPTVRRRLL